MRSWLLVPSESEGKLARVAALNADVVVLDLTGAADNDRAAARERAREWMEANRQQVVKQKSFERWVRIGALDTPYWREDLAATISAAPEGIILPGVTGTSDVQNLAAELYELEQRNQIGHASVRIVAQVGETPHSALAVPELAGDSHPRLAGLAWNAAGLAHSLGASRTINGDGQWTDTMRKVRADTLLAAHARGIMALETPQPQPREGELTKRQAMAARADGFTGMLAIHPVQIAIVNSAFEPTAEERAEAREIVALFESSPNAATIGFRGQIIDRTRLERARALVGLD